MVAKRRRHSVLRVRQRFVSAWKVAAIWHLVVAPSHEYVQRSSCDTVLLRCEFQPDDRLEDSLDGGVRWCRITNRDVACIRPRPHGGGAGNFAGDFAGDFVFLHETTSSIF